MKEHYESIDHFIMAHSRVCHKCSELRTNYELNPSGVCIYCTKENSNDQATSKESKAKVLFGIN